MKNRLITAIVSILICGTVASAQIATGGGFTIEKSAVATGGGSSSNGVFNVTGTTGQNAAGTVTTSGLLNQVGGFWSFDGFVPTSATVAISGKVKTSGGAGIRNVLVTLTDMNGSERSTFTGTFGAFRFSNVEVGQNYTLKVSAKKFSFANPTKIISVLEELTELDFIAIEH